ncbi:tRNA (guanosine(18)-2'-O)-methyltransferase TrmH [Seongchinamella sediminis]|uniref:tRNA (guanosine(18)-2'-O)-methyltransferase n=1 Tax=Seongchinamella sediminis TaxID=2283635 RepID=A0A3L7E503_9GAMM|nr:tRNA (guanosine(18)-2'-O)-methyltransferase TrmH [Seongchinamella sediminis]RLQ23763.1 tRNA (guanosine(18)-2'-O)-methyltransferase TrmH [Seongchinamella sediminis]
MTPERIARLRAVLDKRQPDLTVITDFVHKQRNLSAIVRNCDAVGIQTVHAVIGDEDYRAFRGTAMGSHSWVDVERHREPLAVLASLKAEGYQVLAAHLGQHTVDYRALDYTRPTAILLGAERRGVSDAALSRVDHCIAIPMVGMVESYNVAVAAGIILAEAQRQRAAAGMYQSPRLDAPTWQRLFFEWGHPKVRDYCRERGLAYPPLDADGEIDNPAAWYARVRAGTAPMEEGA